MSANDDIRALIESKKQLRDEQGKFYKKTFEDYVNQYKLDKSDTRVLALLAQQEDIEHPEQEALKLANSMRGPTEADLPAGVAKTVRHATGKEALWDEYQRERKKTPSHLLPALKIKFRQKGLRELH